MPDNESPDRYASELEDFLRVTIKILRGHASGIVMPLDEGQKLAGNALIKALGEIKDSTKDLHKFLYPLLVAQPHQRNPTIWDCPFQNWLAIRALRDDGNFLTPEQTTGILARMKYFIRSSAILEAYERHEDHQQGMIG